MKLSLTTVVYTVFGENARGKVKKGEFSHSSWLQERAKKERPLETVFPSTPVRVLGDPNGRVSFAFGMQAQKTKAGFTTFCLRGDVNREPLRLLCHPCSYKDSSPTAAYALFSFSAVR